MFGHSILCDRIMWQSHQPSRIHAIRANQGLKCPDSFIQKSEVKFNECQKCNHSVLRGVWRLCFCKYGPVDSPGHTLQCYTPAMVCSKGAVMPENRMRCAAMCCDGKFNMLNILPSNLEYLSH